MKLMVKLRTARFLAVLMTCLVAIPYLACGALAAQPKGNLTQTVVLFPLNKAAGVAKADVVDQLNEFLNERLTACDGYKVIAYSGQLPAIQRLIAMQPEKKEITEGPFSTDTAGISRAADIGKAMSADILIVGNVNQYVFDSNTGMAQITASIEVVDGITGRSIQPITVTGKADKPANGLSASEANIASEAIKDAGRKIIEEVTGEKIGDQAQTATVQSKKGEKKSWASLLLISLALGLLLGGGGGGGGGSSSGDGTDPPPDPPF